MFNVILSIRTVISFRHLLLVFLTVVPSVLREMITVSLCAIHVIQFSFLRSHYGIEK